MRDRDGCGHNAFGSTLTQMTLQAVITWLHNSLRITAAVPPHTRRQHRQQTALERRITQSPTPPIPICDSRSHLGNPLDATGSHPGAIAAPQAPAHHPTLSPLAHALGPHAPGIGLGNGPDTVPTISTVVTGSTGTTRRLHGTHFKISATEDCERWVHWIYGTVRGTHGGRRRWRSLSHAEASRSSYCLPAVMAASVFDIFWGALSQHRQTTLALPIIHYLL